MSEQTTTYKDLITILHQPKAVFAKIKFAGGCWKPLLLLSIFYFIMTMVYQNNVDHEWLADKQVQIFLDFGLVQPENVATFKSELLTKSTSAVQIWTQNVVAAFTPLLIVFVITLYYSLVGNIITDEYRFGDWFRFVCWVLLPMSIGFFGIMIGISLNDTGRVSSENANVFGWPYLLSGLELNEKWQNLLGVFNVTNLWCFYLSIIGLRTWTQKSYVSCSFIVLLPVSLIAVAIAYFA